MGFNPVKDAMRKAATRQKIIGIGFRVFAEQTIDAVNLTDEANAAGVSAVNWSGRCSPERSTSCWRRSPARRLDWSTMPAFCRRWNCST